MGELINANTVLFFDDRLTSGKVIVKVKVTFTYSTYVLVMLTAFY